MLVINKKSLTIFALVIMSVFTLTACDKKEVVSAKKSNDKTVDIKEWKTSNGVKVLYVHAPELPMVDIKAVFDAGSIHNGNKPGLASLTSSLLSHGALLGDKILSVDDISERFDSVGARFSSGATKDNAQIGLRSLTDEKWLSKSIASMQAIINAPSFDEKELERVRKQLLIGFEGRKQSPGTIASEAFYKKLYKGHPYAVPSIGTEESVKKLSRKDLMAFYEQYYVAKNALVTIVGDVDREKAESLAEQIVGKLPAGERAAKLPTVNDLQEASATHHEFPSSQTHISMGHPGIHRKDKDYFTSLIIF